VPWGVRLEGEELPADPVPGVAACALRELFEETGVLPLAGGPPAGIAALEAMRERVLADPSRFGAELARLGAPPDASALAFAGRWLTPPFAPVRFDNRFFLLEWPAERAAQPRVLPGELEHGEWIAPGEALARWRRAEAIAAPPILHLLGVLDEDGPLAGLPRLRDPREADLGPSRRIEFRPGVVMIPLAAPTLPPATHTNAYLLGLEEAVVVDPGSPAPAEQDRLLASVRDAEPRLGRRVGAIWLTHHHPDHVGGAAALRAALGVPVHAHRDAHAALGRQGVPVDGELAEGQRVELGRGFPVRVLHTPGHARGHVCFLAEAHRSLLCGDLVSALSTVVIDPPEGHMGDYFESLSRAAALDPATLFPAHGPLILDGKQFLAGVLEHRRRREEKVLLAWRGGITAPEEIVRHAYDEELPAMIEPLAARQVSAHLEHLRQRGEIP
jgi:endoribonuclease LACTB2